MQPAWMQQAADQAATAEPVHAAAPEIVPGRVLHIDGDMIAYWAGGNEDTSVETSRRIALTKVDAMREQSGAEKVIMHLTAESSSKADRYIIATVKPYQGQRKSGRKPHNWQYLRTYLETYTGDAFKVKLWATREADDGMALMAYQAQGEQVICTKDKDMRMLPGLHMDWDTMALHFVARGAYDGGIVDGKQYGTKWFWLQMLQGDTADNIPGLPYFVVNGKLKQCGEKTAVKLLDCATNDTEAYEIVQGLYHSYYEDKWAAMFIEQALLLWLRCDFNASLFDVQRVLPMRTELTYALLDVQEKIKEKYAEAHRLTGQSPTRQDVG